MMAAAPLCGLPFGTCGSLFGSHMAARFGAFLVKAPVLNVMGSGPVPSFAPPLVPAAPVTGGRCSGSNVLPTWSMF
jgi:hypothetical protein